VQNQFLYASIAQSALVGWYRFLLGRAVTEAEVAIVVAVSKLQAHGLGEYGALPFLQACLIANRPIAGPTFRAQLAAPSVVS
jgi:hypothetical protein